MRNKKNLLLPIPAHFSWHPWQAQFSWHFCPLFLAPCPLFLAPAASPIFLAQTRRSLRLCRQAFISWFSLSPMKRTFDTQSAPAVAPAKERILFIVARGVDRTDYKLYTFTPTEATRFVLDELLAFVEDFTKSGHDEDDEPVIYWDMFDYLCGTWPQTSHPPSTLPLSLLFTPREQLGEWHALPTDDTGFQRCKGAWSEIVELLFFDEVEGTQADRAMSESDWQNQVEMQRDEK